MLVKKTILKGLLAIGIGIPAFAQAADLVITNNTNQDSTVIANKGACSYPALGEVGITRAHKSNTVPESKLKLACMANKSDCKADVYMTSNCSGPIIATASFEVVTKDGKPGQGLKSIQIKDSAYAVTGGGFNITISGGH
ncbi:hypothetical protein [Aquicella lusitana]|jgi:hypothetical protein|uniref:Uncharacterized protein n=1 Tax=Aquicella lusitana TaxID=254246 RepID=A0A370GQR4_9COXI|nr:hypothetical protein [Aquicella lusitana]RDI46058.1 hypothetical protein C8D86_10662 [Aquicella lusitana]VVC73345.1 hypothetical protein AQULUS_10840 [Aquicella lusitana]